MPGVVMGAKGERITAPAGGTVKLIFIGGI